MGSLVFRGADHQSAWDRDRDEGGRDPSPRIARKFTCGCTRRARSRLSVPEVWKQEQFTKGDENIPAIAIASIMAKVTRDKYMVGLADKHPGYGFESHKGYGTKVHQDAIRSKGPIKDIHRTLFIRSLI
jgi:ribonuclease HII